jgi:hypothetical protein
MNSIPPSRIKLIIISTILVIAIIAINKLCTGKFLPNIRAFNSWITPNFEPIKNNTLIN